jgi:hypothetical protein
MLTLQKQPTGTFVYTNNSQNRLRGCSIKIFSGSLIHYLEIPPPQAAIGRKVPNMHLGKMFEYISQHEPRPGLTIFRDIQGGKLAFS